MLPEDHIPEIEAWLDGAMHADEQAAFAARIQADPALAAAVALQEQMRQAVQEKDIGVFRQIVDGLLDEHRAGESSTPKSVQMSRYRWAIAAALLLALAAIWLFIPRSLTPEELYAAAFDPPDHFANGSLRLAFKDRDTGSVNTLSGNWTALNTAWAAADLDKALSLALEISRTDTVEQNRPAAFYAAGIIALAQKKPEIALEYLPKAAGLPVYAEDILWYTALAHVQITFNLPDHKKQAKAALEKVRQSSQPKGRYELAEKLLELVGD